jgi:hypothetical protein
MKSSYFLASVAAVALLCSTANAFQESMATLKDPHGSIQLSCDGDTNTTLKAGEHCLVERISNGWNVYLKSGCQGFIGKADLRLLPNEPLMKLNYNREKKLWQKLQSARHSERYDASSAEEHGVNYFQLLTAASNGDLKAMARFFSLARFMDTSAAEEYYPEPERWALVHM